jgi:hypothetical protein
LHVTCRLIAGRATARLLGTDRNGTTAATILEPLAVLRRSAIATRCARAPARGRRPGAPGGSPTTRGVVRRPTARVSVADAGPGIAAGCPRRRAAGGAAVVTRRARGARGARATRRGDAFARASGLGIAAARGKHQGRTQSPSGAPRRRTQLHGPDGTTRAWRAPNLVDVRGRPLSCGGVSPAFFAALLHDSVSAVH